MSTPHPLSNASVISPIYSSNGVVPGGGVSQA